MPSTDDEPGANPGGHPEPPGEPPGTLAALLAQYPDLADAPPALLKQMHDLVWVAALAEAQAEAETTSRRPAGRAVDGLADLADLVLISPRSGPIDRLARKALEVEVDVRGLLIALDHLAEEADEFLARDPAIAVDEFERIEMGNAREVIYARLRDTTAEVATKADQLRGLL